MTLEQRLKEIAERADKATPGPWILRDLDLHEGGVGFEIERPGEPYGTVVLNNQTYYPTAPTFDDADLIANSRADITLLLALCEIRGKALNEIQAEIERGKVKSCLGCCNGNDIPEEELCRACWRIWTGKKMYLLWDWHETERRIADVKEAGEGLVK